MQLVGADLRSFMLGRMELVRRLYMVVRDVNWRTIPPEVSDLDISDRGDVFRATFLARNSRCPIDFRWRGTIEGFADGSVTYAMEGEAQSEFRYNKIHLCVHHPILGAAGRPFYAETPKGSIVGQLPSLVGSQVLDSSGTAIPLFPAFTALTIQASAQVAVRFEFAGDLWETEDHRNWTDASSRHTERRNRSVFRP